MTDDPRLGRDFRRLLVASGASNLGDGIRATALPLLALRLTDEPVLVSAVAAATFVPAVVLGPLGGAVVDRHPRRRLMVWGQLLRALAVAVFVLAVLGEVGDIWALYAVAVVLGLGEVVVDSAAQAVVPQLAPRSLLERANGRVITVQLVADDLVGATLGGVLFALTPVLPFVVDAVTFLVGALVVATISRPLHPHGDDTGTPPAESEVAPGPLVDRTRGVTADRTRGVTADPTLGVVADPTRGVTADPTRGVTTDPTRGVTADPTRGVTADGPASLLAEARDGFRFVLVTPVLRAMAVAVSLSNLAGMAGTSVLVLLVVDDLGASEGVFGLVSAAGALGGVVASSTAARLVARVGRARVLVGACAVDAAAFALLAWSPSVPVVAAGMAVFVGAVMAFNVPGRAVRQEVTPERLLGRVTASYRVLGYVGVPVGALLGGIVTDLAGVRAAFVLATLLLVVVTAVMGRAVRHLPPRDPASSPLG